MRTGMFIVAALLVWTGAFSQMRAQDCVTALDRAGDLYRAGEFGSVIDLLSPCVEEKQLDRESAWQAYRLIALSNLYLDRPEEAEAAIRRMLDLNPTYEPNPERDPEEFIRPLARYGSFPRLQIGVRLAGGIVTRGVVEDFSVTGDPLAAESSLSRFGSDIALTLEPAITPQLSVITGVSYSSREFGTETVNAMNSTVSQIESYVSVGVPLGIKVKLGSASIRPYLQAGYIAHLRIDSRTDYDLVWHEDSVLVGELPFSPEESLTDVEATGSRRTSVNQSLFGGAGAELQLGPGRLSVGIQYEHGIDLLNLPERRFAAGDQMYDFLAIDDDFRISMASICIGYQLPITFEAYRK